MVNKIKAIETHYKGYRFRSRLEARWAVYFETLGCHWQYELEGFELGGGLRYLPDFRIGWHKGDESKMWWAEVKPQPLSDAERVKTEAFARTVGPVILLIGTPGFVTYPVLELGSNNALQEIDIVLGEHKARGRFYLNTGRPALGPIFESDVCDPDRIRLAVEAARSARFEFGETPK